MPRSRKNTTLTGSAQADVKLGVRVKGESGEEVEGKRCSTCSKHPEHLREDGLSDATQQIQRKLKTNKPPKQEEDLAQCQHRALGFPASAAVGLIKVYSS